MQQLKLFTLTDLHMSLFFMDVAASMSQFFGALNGFSDPTVEWKADRRCGSTLNYAMLNPTKENLIKYSITLLLIAEKNTRKVGRKSEAWNQVNATSDLHYNLICKTKDIFMHLCSQGVLHSL